MIEGIVECLYDLSQAGHCTDAAEGDAINANKGEKATVPINSFHR